VPSAASDAELPLAKLLGTSVALAQARSFGKTQLKEMTKKYRHSAILNRLARLTSSFSPPATKTLLWSAEAESQQNKSGFITS